MNNVEQVKESINGLSSSDQTDVLLHVLRLRYQTSLREIRQLAQGDSLNALPDSIDNFTYDELLERLHLLEGIREGLDDSAKGNTISQEAVKQMFEQWRRKQ
jgi:hypothetical protein